MSTGRRARLGRFAGFFGAPLLSLVTPLLLLPIVARTVTETQWAALAVGQSLGAVAALVVAWGWPLHGPAAVAGEASEVLAATGRVSLRERGTVLAVVLLPAMVTAVLLAPDGAAVLTVLAALAGASAGLSPAWFAAGAGRPSVVVRFELVPRLVAVLACAALVPLTGVPELYPAALIGAAVIGVVLFLRTEAAPRAGVLPAGPAQRAKALAMATEVAGGLYSSALVAIAATVLATSAVAQLSSADRIYRLATFVIVAAVAALQVSVHAGGVEGAGSRQRQAVLIHLGIGAGGGAALAVLGPAACAVLFGAALTPPAGTFPAYGAAFLLLSLNASVGRHVLVARGRLGAVLASTVAGTIVGVPAILLGGALGPVGVAAAVVVSEAVVLAVQAAALLLPPVRLRRPLAAIG